MQVSSHAEHLPPHVHHWTPDSRLTPWNGSTYAALANCSHLLQLLASMPSDAPKDPRWHGPWAEYVEQLYGKGARSHFSLLPRPRRTVDVSRFTMLRGVALRNATHRVTDRALWHCGTHIASNVRAQGTRAILVWPTRGPASRAASWAADDGQWIEVYRSDYGAAGGPEGLGYGCWFHGARGAGTWINVGRTLRLASRADAVATIGTLGDVASGSPIEPLSTHRTSAAPRACAAAKRGGACGCYWCLAR
eukprot:4323442-Prymnesium_polylepis.1